MLQEMISQARTVRTHAYSPYSHFSVGVCIKSVNDNLYCGCNIENASYGLTLCAEAAAVAQMVSHGEQQIVAVVIIATKNKLITPCGACRQLLWEFAQQNQQLPIHLGDDQHIHKVVSLGELLPMAFGPENLNT